MPFLGTTPTQGFVGANPKQSFTANGSTTVFTLNNPVASANDLEVFVGNVRQEPTAAYTAAGTTLTMSEAPATGLNFYVINKSFAQVTTTPPVNSISTDRLLNDAVTGAKIENNPTIAGNLIVSGTSTLTGNTTASGTLTATGKITSTAGITFGSDTAAANVLDDYEEGTWTPYYVASGGGTVTTGTKAGFYTKIGKLVMCHFHLRSTGVSGVSGDIQIHGFPFTATASGRTSRAGGQRFYARSWGSDMPEFHFGVSSGSTYALLYRHAMNASALSVTTSQFSSGGDNNVIEASITYEVDG